MRALDDKDLFDIHGSDWKEWVSTQCKYVTIASGVAVVLNITVSPAMVAFCAGWLLGEMVE